MWYLLLAEVLLAAADLPVHCLRHQLLGRWRLYVGPPSKERSVCGHERPDLAWRQPAVRLSNSSVHEVELLDPNVVHSSSGLGHWTMIYDEAFEVNVDDLSFLAFFRFELSEMDGVQRNVSHCGETQLGWYRDVPGDRWGCFYGEKVEKESPSVAMTSSTSPSSTLLDMAEHLSFVRSLNLLQDVWKATVYERLVGKTLRELNGMAGIFRARTQEPGAVSFMQRARARSKAVRPRRPLPSQWDWRNVSGRSYLDPVIDQGTCGSCYVVATTHMLAARYRIKQQDPSFEGFSFNFPLFCSEYNQGCDGGYAFLAARWAADVGLVPKNCSLNDPQAERKVCELRCPTEGLKTWRAVNHHYVGGYYGATSEDEMKQELVQDGPLVVSFEPQSDLLYYRGGIYSSVSQQRAEWEPVDHAVLLVGYGSEAGRKYWLLQNSWGSDWGEEGYMRMVRGSDESGVESIAEGADVLLEPRPAEGMLQFAAVSQP